LPNKFSGPATPPVDPDMATEADVYHAYRLILRREPDGKGLAHYTELVAAGLTLDGLLHSFLNSDERLRLVTRQRRDAEAAVDLGGYQVVVHRDDPDFGAIIVSYQVYEEHVRKALREHLGPGDVCLDVGANVGVMTFLAASRVGPGGRVIAVEPNPDNVQLLYRGILLNGFTNVEVLPLAATDHRAVFSLSGRSNTELVDPDSPDTNGRLVQSVVLDEVLHDLPRLDLVKMDVEGHEPAALRGLLRLVATHRPTLVVEFNPRCLAHLREDAVAFLGQILDLYPAIRAISPFGDDESFRRADDLMAFWRRRAAEVTDEGKLPEGLLHFDLVTQRE